MLKVSFAAACALAVVAHVSAFSAAPAALPGSLGRAGARMTLRGSAGRSGVACASMQAASGRREFLRVVGAGLALPVVVGGAASSLAADEGVVVEVGVKVLSQIAGGSQKEFDEFDAKPSKPLEGPEAAIYKLYKYAAFKCPAMEDPRASLRGLFTSRVADGVYKYAMDKGINPKVYDARGDGLTNQGKGGAIKGVTTLLTGLKKQGLVQDFTIDSSKHDENSWLQSNPTSISVAVTGPVGLKAGQLLAEEKVGLTESLTASALQGYFKQVKLFVNFEQSFEGDVENLKINLSWAGKDRQKSTLKRRSEDKLNAARAYTKDKE